MTETSPAQDILDFWFGELDSDGVCRAEMSRRWFTKDTHFDAEIFKRFGWLHAVLSTCASRDQRPKWVFRGEGILAAILVVDQFSRNIFRGTPGMFAADPIALGLALEAVGLGQDRSMPAPYATFCYMPLMHSERLVDQERCVELFEALHQRHAGPARGAVSSNLSFAIQHRDIVRRFGRFPHRNAVLGRTNTPEEEAFLKEPGSSF